MTDPVEILAQFATGAPPPVHLSPLGAGHINDTFLVGTDSARFILQRINAAIFPDAATLMDNFSRITTHLRSRGATTLELIPTVEDVSFHRDAGGDAWRLVRYIENTRTATVPPTPQQAYCAAAAYGEFARHLCDLPGPRLHEVIPGFHDTPRRLGDFLSALEADPQGRTDGAREEIEAILEHRDWCPVIAGAIAEGSVPERIVHNDAKLDNVLFDTKTGKVACVIDLDTVMPGSFLHDFGDLVRSAAATAAEDETDLNRVTADQEIIDHLTNGFLHGCGDMLTARERELLPLAGKFVAHEQAMRFLTDYLLGDPYYKIHHPGHNLERARNQLQLVKSLAEAG
ncbi:MAG: aminoglycoside phosphotransferase family protein [Verrucomicrobiaceae bacterium]|nr:aminoglycoside phosphotransferase family protein [Verrucomicrobiaceae bacterium]